MNMSEIKGNIWMRDKDHPQLHVLRKIIINKVYIDRY